MIVIFDGIVKILGDEAVNKIHHVVYFRFLQGNEIKTASQGINNFIMMKAYNSTHFTESKK